MPDRILTSHAGSLPRPEDLIALNQRRAAGDFPDEAEYLRHLRAAVADVVARQRDTGIDLVNDGEFGHSMGQRYDYGSWWTYVFQRLGGVELTQAELTEIPQAKAKPGEIVLASFAERRDWLAFADAYGDPTSGVALPNREGQPAPVCRGPITYQGHEAVKRDIADMKAAMEAAGVSDGFLNSVAPGSCARFGNPAGSGFEDAAQAVLIERYATIKKNSQWQMRNCEAVLYLTSLTKDDASPEDLLALARGHWIIEHTHWLRDVIWNEDKSLLRTGNAPQVMSALTNLVITLFRIQGVTGYTEETRRNAQNPRRALRLLALSPG